MANIVEITDLNAPETAAFARLTEAQLRSRVEPEKGVFIAESPKVIERALDAGYEPVSLLMERRHIEGDARDIIDRCGEIPVYTAGRELLAGLTGYQLTRGCCAPCAGPYCPGWRNCAAAPAGWRCWRASWITPMWGPSSAPPRRWV